MTSSRAVFRGFDFSRRCASNSDWAILENPKSFARYTCDQNLGMLGTKQMGRPRSRILDVTVPNPVRNIYAQVLGFAPM